MVKCVVVLPYAVCCMFAFKWVVLLYYCLVCFAKPHVRHCLLIYYHTTRGMHVLCAPPDLFEVAAA